MKKAVLFIIVCSMTSLIYAQKADTTIVFNKLVHDFSSIAINGWKVDYSFEFTNKGAQPVTIQNVASTCGCTTSVSTKEPVEPGKTGYITVTYRPSAITTFDRSVSVKFAGGNPETIVLRIRGNVTASVENW